MNVRVNLQEPIRDGMEVVFKAPCDASVVTGLNVYYPVDGVVASQAFTFADANTNDLGHLDALFGKDAVVKVILDLDTNMAFVQNADTNAYLERRLASMEYYHTTREELGVAHENANADYIWGLYDDLMVKYPANVQKKEYQSDDGIFTNYAYEISTGEYSGDGDLIRQSTSVQPDTIKKPKCLILSGVHGTERVAALSVYRFIRDVLDGHNVPYSFKEGVIIRVFPIGDPADFDAFKYAENGNVNRDFNSATPMNETQAIIKWLKENDDADLFIDAHNGGQTNEIVAVLGDYDHSATDTVKKLAMKGIDRIIPFWKDVIKYPSEVETRYTDENGELQVGVKDVIFSYSAYAKVVGSSTYYASNTLDIPSLSLEMAVYHGNHSDWISNKKVYPPETIAAGAEALGNILIEFYEQSFMCEVVDDMKEVNGKLDTLLQSASFGIVKGTDYAFDGTQFCVPLSEKPKLVIWRATEDTQERISTVVQSGADSSKLYSVGGIMNFAMDIDTTSYMYTKLGKNYNSLLSCYQYYTKSVNQVPAKETQAKYEDGYAKMAVVNFQTEFDTTPAEYEWTAYYWNE